MSRTSPSRGTRAPRVTRFDVLAPPSKGIATRRRRTRRSSDLAHHRPVQVVLYAAVTVTVDAAPARELLPPDKSGAGTIRAREGVAAVSVVLGARCRGVRTTSSEGGERFVGSLARGSGGRRDRAARPRDRVQGDRQGTGHGERGRSCVALRRFWPFSHTIARSSWRVGGGAPAGRRKTTVSWRTPVRGADTGARRARLTGSPPGVYVKPVTVGIAAAGHACQRR